MDLTYKFDFDILFIESFNLRSMTTLVIITAKVLYEMISN